MVLFLFVCLVLFFFLDTQIPWRDCYKLKQHEKTFAGIHDSKNGNNKGNSKKNDNAKIKIKGT